MVYRDSFGNSIEENDVLAFPVGFGQMVQGVVVKTAGSLVGGDGQQQIPHIMLTVTLPIQANPQNGLVPGVMKIGTAEKS